MPGRKSPRSFSSKVKVEPIMVTLQSRQKAGDRARLFSQLWSYLGPEEPSSEGRHTLNLYLTSQSQLLPRRTIMGSYFFASYSWWGKDTHSDQRLQTKAPALPSGERKIKGPLSWSDHRASHRTPKELHLLDRLQKHGGFSLNLSFSFPLPSTPSARGSWLLALQSIADKGLGEGERAQPS